MRVFGGMKGGRAHVLIGRKEGSGKKKKAGGSAGDSSLRRRKGEEKIRVFESPVRHRQKGEKRRKLSQLGGQKKGRLNKAGKEGGVPFPDGYGLRKGKREDVPTERRVHMKRIGGYYFELKNDRKKKKKGTTRHLPPSFKEGGKIYALSSYAKGVGHNALLWSVQEKNTRKEGGGGRRAFFVCTYVAAWGKAVILPFAWSSKKKNRSEGQEEGGGRGGTGFGGEGAVESKPQHGGGGKEEKNRTKRPAQTTSKNVPKQEKREGWKMGGKKSTGRNEETKSQRCRQRGKKKNSQNYRQLK